MKKIIDTYSLLWTTIIWADIKDDLADLKSKKHQQVSEQQYPFPHQFLFCYTLSLSNDTVIKLITSLAEDYR